MKRSIIFGCISSVVGFSVGYYFRGLDGNLPILSGISAFIGSSLMWLLIVDRPNNWSEDRGVVAGVSGAIVAHYLNSYISLLIANYGYWILGKQIGSLPGPPMDPLFGILAMLFYMLLSLLIIGWFTIPVGALIGVVYVKTFSPVR